MIFFDVSKSWVILAPVGQAGSGAAEELSRCVGLLRGGAGLRPDSPPVEDAGGEAPEDSVPIIILNAAGRNRDLTGFSWRLGKDRLEIHGDSERGLCNGIYDFLAELGIRWPEPGREELPACAAAGKAEGGLYPLGEGRAYSRSITSPAERRRLFIAPEKSLREKEALIQWAARNRIDAPVFSFLDKSLKPGTGLAEKIEKYALITERGGWDLSILVPRRYFLFHPDLFRMDEGRRRRDHNFCPTNHETIGILKKEAEKFFRICGTEKNRPPWTPVYHLWADKDHEKTWCSCPACRAFTPAEQNRIAVNAAADVLAVLDPAARLSYYEESDPAQAGIPESRLPVRENLFRLKRLPGKKETPL
jgi:hypothetical protein